MSNKALWVLMLGVGVLGNPQNGHALRVAEFGAICAQAGRPCEELPVLQAYVGGALDLVAMLHEETAYLAPIYCVEPEDLFDVPAIIRFIGQRTRGNEQRNAMLLVIRYLEEHGGCP